MGALQLPDELLLADDLDRSFAHVLQLFVRGWKGGRGLRDSLRHRASREEQPAHGPAGAKSTTFPPPRGRRPPPPSSSEQTSLPPAGEAPPASGGGVVEGRS